MKTIVISLSFLLLSLSFMSCEKDNIKITPSDTITEQTHSISYFDELVISDLFDVYIQFSEMDVEMRIEANANLHSLIEVDQSNGRLSIQLDDDVRSINGTPVLKVYLTANKLEYIKAEGAASVFLQNAWDEDQIEVELSGACSLEGTLSATQFTAELTGASNLTLEGSVEYTDIQAEGASDMTGFSFETDKLKADLSGGCYVALTVHKELDVTASGASKVHYQGDGVITSQDLSGGSEIIKE